MLWNRELTTDLREVVTDLTIPAYFLHGVERLEAPVTVTS